MAFTDDPKGSQRGQSGNLQELADRRTGEFRQSVRQDPRVAARPPAARQDDNSLGVSNGADGREFPERPAAQARQQQPTFSNYRPEAYAADKRSARPSEQQQWQEGEHQFVDETLAHTPGPVLEDFRPSPAALAAGTPHHDPYQNGAGDPYDNGGRDFDAAWRATDGFQEQTSGQQFAASSYYQPHEDQPAPDAQSVHDRFFAANAEPERAIHMSQPAPAAPRFRANEFDADGYQSEERAAPRAAKPAPAGEPARGFEEPGGHDYRWDSFDQQHPAPESVRPFPNAKLGGAEEDLDADYFADEDDFDADEDYAGTKKGGSSKLMAAVLVGAIVTGGGLAYMYKNQLSGGDTGEPPIMTADTRPIKEKPADPGGREFPGGSKLIYDRLDTGSAEEPTRVAARDQSAENVSPGVITTSASGTLEERIQNALRDAKKQDDSPQQAPANAGNSLDAPRPVKTEIFRPDGSVDSARVQRRQAPTEGETALVSGAAKGVASREAPAQAAAPRQQLAAATPQSAAPAPAVAVGTGGEPGMFVQIAARNDQAAAMAAFAGLQQKYAGVLGSHTPSVRKVDLGEKGVWYRLLVGPMSNKAEADKLCEDLKTAGMKGCFSRKE